MAKKVTLLKIKQKLYVLTKEFSKFVDSKLTKILFSIYKSYYNISDK